MWLCVGAAEKNGATTTEVNGDDDDTVNVEPVGKLMGGIDYCITQSLILGHLHFRVVLVFRPRTGEGSQRGCSCTSCWLLL